MDREPRMDTSTFTQLLSSDVFYLSSTLLLSLCQKRLWYNDYYCIRDGQPGIATLTFTQLLNSDIFINSSSVLLYVHRDHADC